MKTLCRPQASAALLLLVLSLAACSADVMDPPREVPRLSFSELASRAALSGAPSHVIVLQSESGPSQDLLSAVDGLGGSVVSRYDRIGVLVASGLTDVEAEGLTDRSDVQAIGRDVSIQWHPEPDGLEAHSAPGVGAAAPANAFFFDQFQWNMRQIQAEGAWDLTPQGEGALVCILDSGIDPGHIDLQGKIDFDASASFIAEPDIPGVPGLEGQTDLLDYNFHGTFVASQVSTNSLGMASVAPEATLCVVKVLNVFGGGPFSSLTAGIMHAANVGADVINMSLGATIDMSEADGELKALLLALQRAILFANRTGSLLVAASGNEGIDLDAEFPAVITVPSQMVGVVSVSATGPTDQMDFDAFAPYSNFGRTAVQFAAPGGSDPSMTGNSLDGILGACSSLQLTLPFPCDPTSFISGGFGTSFATPHVSGLGAVVESAVSSDLSGLFLTACGIRGADRIDGRALSPQYGFGRINVQETVQQFACGRRFRGFAGFLR